MRILINDGHLYDSNEYDDDDNEDGDDYNKDGDDYNEVGDDDNDFSHLQHLGKEYCNRPVVRLSLSEPGDENIFKKLTLHMSKGNKHAPDV